MRTHGRFIVLTRRFFTDTTPSKASNPPRRTRTTTLTGKKRGKGKRHPDWQAHIGSDLWPIRQIPNEHDTTKIITTLATLIAALADCNYEAEEVYYFMARAFAMGQWSPEANLAAGVLLLRRHRDMDLPLTAAMWRKDMLAALLISQKIIDARPLRNREFSVIWETISEQDEEITPKQINEMEFRFMQEMDFKVFVESPVLIDVYYDLIDIANEDHEEEGEKDLSPEEKEQKKKERRGERERKDKEPKRATASSGTAHEKGMTTRQMLLAAHCKHAANSAAVNVKRFHTGGGAFDSTYTHTYARITT